MGVFFVPLFGVKVFVVCIGSVACVSLLVFVRDLVCCS